jgi:hypothetical protein
MPFDLPPESAFGFAGTADFANGIPDKKTCPSEPKTED